MKPARIAVICIAAVAAIGLALVVRAMGSSSSTPASPAAAADTQPKARVLVAAHDLAAGKKLTEADLDWKEMPVADVNPLYITDGSTPIPAKPVEADAKAEPAKPASGTVEGQPSAVARVARAANDIATGGAKADYVGSVVREPILAGEPIVARKIVRAGDSGFMAASLEPGMRAMAIRVTVETAAGGFILPGDRVDVVLTRQLDNNAGASTEGGGADRAKYATGTVLENLKVLAIDQTTRAGDDEQAVVGATATVEVAPKDAELLALAKAEGELSLVLRSYADTAGPSGAVRGAQRAAVASRNTAVRVYRGGAPEVVTIP
nr:Flp pilus assembly protein CpaB [uncultured Brevundimonas sp.]